MRLLAARVLYFWSFFFEKCPVEKATSKFRQCIHCKSCISTFLESCPLFVGAQSVYTWQLLPPLLQQGEWQVVSGQGTQRTLPQFLPLCRILVVILSPRQNSSNLSPLWLQHTHSRVTPAPPPPRSLTGSSRQHIVQNKREIHVFLSITSLAPFFFIFMQSSRQFPNSQS